MLDFVSATKSDRQYNNIMTKNNGTRWHVMHYNTHQTPMNWPLTERYIVYYPVHVSDPFRRRRRQNRFTWVSKLNIIAYRLTTCWVQSFRLVCILKIWIAIIFFWNKNDVKTAYFFGKYSSCMNLISRHKLFCFK